MNPWIAFSIGVFVGALIGVMILAILRYNKEDE